jgi:hypothetical protein
MRLNRDQLVRDGGLVALTSAVCVSVFLLVDSGTPARTSLDIGDEGDLLRTRLELRAREAGQGQGRRADDHAAANRDL